jgi:nucleotide-binding universal stress UspA family protein
LILLRAAEVTTLPGVDPIDAQVSVVREAEDYLETVAARLRGEGLPRVRTSVWYGAAAPSILEAARLAKPDLIMMSTHGRSGFGRLVFGSVAESVLRDTRTPIFLIRVDGAPVKTPVGRAGAREQEAANV